MSRLRYDQPVETRAELLTAIRNARYVYLHYSIPYTDGWMKMSVDGWKRVSRASATRFFRRFYEKNLPEVHRIGPDICIGGRP
jgi:hypothetical protein